MCAAYCMSSATVGGAAVHHHQMGSHSHRHAANCAECPSETGNGLNRKTSCSKLFQIQTLKEGSLSFAAPSGVAHIYAADTPVRVLALASAADRFSPVKPPNKIRSLDCAFAPLRI